MEATGRAELWELVEGLLGQCLVDLPAVRAGLWPEEVGGDVCCLGCEVGQLPLDGVVFGVCERQRVECAFALAVLAVAGELSLDGPAADAMSHCVWASIKICSCSH